jgi:hypothetical protein
MNVSVSVTMNDTDLKRLGLAAAEAYPELANNTLLFIGTDDEVVAQRLFHEMSVSAEKDAAKDVIIQYASDACNTLPDCDGPSCLVAGIKDLVTRIETLEKKVREYESVEADILEAVGVSDLEHVVRRLEERSRRHCKDA